MSSSSRQMNDSNHNTRNIYNGEATENYLSHSKWTKSN